MAAEIASLQSEMHGIKAVARAAEAMPATALAEIVRLHIELCDSKAAARAAEQKAAAAAVNVAADTLMQLANSCLQQEITVGGRVGFVLLVSKFLMSALATPAPVRHRVLLRVLIWRSKAAHLQRPPLAFRRCSVVCIVAEGAFHCPQLLSESR